jgi:hypothetical protein
VGQSAMAEMFVMCPDCGLNAKIAPGDLRVSDDEGLCQHRQNPMACPILGPILNAMRRAASPREALGGNDDRDGA